MGKPKVKLMQIISLWSSFPSGSHEENWIHNRPSHFHSRVLYFSHILASKLSLFLRLPQGQNVLVLIFIMKTSDNILLQNMNIHSYFSFRIDLWILNYSRFVYVSNIGMYVVFHCLGWFVNLLGGTYPSY